MQTQAQVPGQAPNQATRVQQNGSSVSSQSGNNIGGTFKRPWHTEDDLALRRNVCEQIVHLFKKRKPHVTPEWLPDFVQRLEEALYLGAASKEEYSNIGTLGDRLQSVAQRITPTKSQHGTGVMPSPGNVSAMMPTPGATMIPTPGSSGSMISAGNSHSLNPGSDAYLSSAGSSGSKVATPGSGSMMVPTPGIGSMQSTPNGSPMIQTPGGPHSIGQAAGGIGGLLQGAAMATSGHGTSMIPATMNKLMQSSNHGNMYPNSGGNLMPTSGHANTLANQQVFTGMRMSQIGQVGSGMGLSQGGSQMIPTPGLPTSQSIGINPSSVGGLPMNNAGQQHYSGASTPGYRNLNGQLGPSLNGSLQRKGSQIGVPGMGNGIAMMGNGQLNGGANIHNSSGYMNTAQFTNIQLQSSQAQQLRVNQQRLPQLRMQGDGYSLSQADMNGSGNLYPVVSSAGLVGANMNMSSQPSKMIPVSGLPPQQGMLQQQPSSQQLHIQRASLQQNMGGMSRNQQMPMQMAKSQGMFQQQSSNIGGQKQQGVMDQSQQSMNSVSFQHAASDQHQGPRAHMPPQQHQQVSSLQRQGIQQNMMNHQHLRQQQPQRPQQQQQMQLKQNQPQQSTQLQAQHQQLSSQQQQQQPQVQALSHSQTQGQTPQIQQSQQGQMLHHQPPEQQQAQMLQQQTQSQQTQPQQQQQQPLGQPQQLQQVQSQAQQTHQALMQRQQQPQQQVQRSFTQASQLLQRSQMLQQGSMLQQHSGVAHLSQQSQSQAQLQPSTPTAGSPTPGNSLVMSVTSDNASNVIGSGNANGPTMQGSETADAQRAQQYVKQRRWLLFLRHASKCQAPEGQCQTTPHCHVARQLWAHLSTCRQERDCSYTRCTASRTLVRHYQQCREPRCPVCAPVRQILSQNRAQTPSQVQPGQGQPATTSPQASGQVGSPSLALPQSGASPIVGMSVSSPQISTPVQGIESDMVPPPAKRAKFEPSGVQVSQQQSVSQPGLSGKAQLISSASAQQNMISRSQGVKLECHAVKTESERSGSHLRTDSQVGTPAQRQKQMLTLGPKGDLGGQSSGSHLVSVKSELGNSSTKQQQGNPAFSAPANAMLPKSGKPKIVGTSLIELFTPEQIREHITGLRQWVGQSKAKAEKNQAMEQKMTDNSCHLCAVERLTFEPPPIYCTACGARIKRNNAFYTLAAGETRHYCCTACYNECRTDSVEMDGASYPKVKLEKRRNDEETEEAWVQCDKCNLWQHQVCALFNGRRNEGGEAEYTCPQCLAAEMERGERKPLPPSAVLGAKDMPKTLLSDHLETRLARKLDAERQQRAALAGKSKEEVPGAEALVVRVVSSVDKKLEVKQRFMEMFQDEDYPTEFPYKSKVVLLFQKIEGVEVCLFGMYVQEFGVDCAHPNQRRVYLSYLDSVKYFRPDVKTVSGEALRTFVYHEILIGYLEHCKKRGFSSCYIWACPPLKGEDYILYCHPEIQKTPKSDKLREWYLTMLRKAAKESIVVEVTNLYDYFFTSTVESKAKVTAARLPYFDGDYWPGAAEDMILQLQQEEEDGRKLQKKGKTKKATTTKRNAKVAGQAELPSNASDDARLMYKLGESILPMKEDFIMVHMHHSCAHCRTFIVSGQFWSCQSCPYFKLCHRCYEVEQKVDERERHRGSTKDPHVFEGYHISDVPADTKDKDEIMESEFFDTRQAFLSLCQGNHYQYDTLRRAKHSSMMVLYHLHNPTAPAFVATCNNCNRDIDTGQGWRCETCVDFDLCNTCKESATHEHKLVLHSERNAQNKEARQMRVLQLRKMLELLVHASQCAMQSQCDYPKCHSVKALFRHGMYCTVRASGGCALCKRMWYLLQLHARACKEAVCRVPRCKDLKEHLRRLTHQAESRRRAAVNEMMRQRAAEAAGNTG